MIKFTIIFLWSCLVTYAFKEFDHTYYWRDYRGKVPSDAFMAGEDMYLGQVHSPTGLLPATFYPNKTEAYATCYGRRLIVTSAIKLLCDQHPEKMFWEYVNIDKMKDEDYKNVVVGGVEVNSTLYVGKIFFEGDWRIGKVYPADHKWKGLTVWRDNGTDCSFHDFQILKFKANYSDVDLKKDWL